MLIKNIFKRFTQNFQKINLEVHNQVAIISMNSPKDFNCLSEKMKSQLCKGIREMQKKQQIKVMLLKSDVKKAFCAGANIKDFQNKTAKDFENNDIFKQMTQTFINAQKPIISAVNGVALGGGFQLALLTDIIICSEQTKFGLPQLNLGLIPGIGGNINFPKRVGKYVATKYILTSEFISSEKALQLGLVTDVFPYQKLHQQVAQINQALKLAKKISQKSKSSLIAAKKSIRASQNNGVIEGLKQQRRIFYPLFDTKGSKVGVEAFVKKQKPNFDDC